ncbi:hypothetical protein [Cupriavidus taiwanensis]|uniref:hypothetical protein n=1 Tax=Cupriavidus taiwanensis TaxID=164546 RepID=UPI000E1A629A|nr:hypothetical protein [Cupriavidus taiwanensis]SOZ97323.1 hypothetical protein CBM2598_U70015 [Cupriavidus taiwanensis]
MQLLDKAMLPIWRRDLDQEIKGYHLARDLRRITDPESVEWNIYWYGCKGLHQQIADRIELLGGLMGEW